MRPWTVAEEQALKELAHLGAGTIAEAFDRSVPSVKIKASYLGVSLRQKPGQINHTKVIPHVYDRIQASLTAELCPSCGKYRVAVRRTGLCAKCHLRRLAEVHEEEIARIEAQRELWTARKRLQRAREADDE